MRTTRVEQMLAGLDLSGSSRETLDGLCVACASEFSVSGAGIALIVGGTHRGTLGTSDAAMGAVEELQVTFAEGPCMDAYTGGSPVIEATLAGTARWPLFAPAALDAGIHAVFAFPLQAGAARFGALDLYRSTPGPLSHQDIDDAGSIASLVTALVLMTQAGAPPGALPEAVGEFLDDSAVVHQAVGMVSVQLGVSIEDANVALRAHAFAAETPITRVATAVVKRRIRLDP